MLSLYKEIQNIKQMVIDKLDHLETFKTFIKTEKGYVNVRFSFSKYNSVEEVDYVVNKIEEIRSF